MMIFTLKYSKNNDFLGFFLFSVAKTQLSVIFRLFRLVISVIFLCFLYCGKLAILPLSNPISRLLTHLFVSNIKLLNQTLCLLYSCISLLLIRYILFNNKNVLYIMADDDISKEVATPAIDKAPFGPSQRLEKKSKEDQHRHFVQKHQQVRKGKVKIPGKFVKNFD